VITLFAFMVLRLANDSVLAVAATVEARVPIVVAPSVNSVTAGLADGHAFLLKVGARGPCAASPSGTGLGKLLD